MGTAPGLPVLEKSAVVMSTAKEPPPQSGETEANGRPEGVSSVAHMPRIGGALPKVPAFRPQRGPMLLGRVKNKSMVMEYAPAANAVVCPDIDLTPAPSARFYGRISCLPSVVKEPPFYLDVRALLRARVIAEVREGTLELERIISGAKDALNVVHRSNDGPAEVARRQRAIGGHYQSSKFKYGADIMAPPGRP
jgi:hypothetical protein